VGAKKEEWNMWKNIGLESCVSFIQSEFRPKGTVPEAPPPPAITISRMTGAGGHTVASALAEYLQSRAPDLPQWTVFDQNLVEKVLEGHDMQKYVTDFMEERHRSMVRDSVEEWIGLHPSSWNVTQWINATMLRLAQAGNVILIGRGSTVIASKVKTAFHVRLVSSLERRLERVEQIYGFDRKGAMSYVKKKDEGRRKYLKDNFDADIDSPFLYHLVINMDLFSYDEAAGLIGDEALKRAKTGVDTKDRESQRRVVHR
jgi:cytidylate kinase